MSQLIISNSKKQAKNYIEGVIEKIEGKSVNTLNNIDVITNYAQEDKIATENIREYINSISKKPTELKNKYLILYNFEQTNKNAQNAFLKTLEEGNTSIFLHAKSTANLLTTTLSRLKVKKLKNEIEKNEKIYNLIKKIIDENNVEKIFDLNKKFELKEILDNLEIFLKDNKNKKGYAKALNKIYKLKKRSSETNLNNDIQLTNVFVDLLG